MQFLKGGTLMCFDLPVKVDSIDCIWRCEVKYSETLCLSYHLKVVYGLHSLCLAFHSANKGLCLTMDLMHRHRCKVQMLIFLFLHFQEGPKQRTCLSYLARAIFSFITKDERKA